MTSLMGCSDSLNLNPWEGSSSTGALIVTPSIGPATVGAVGVELFEVWQPPSASRRIPHGTANERDVRWTMGNLGELTNIDRQGAHRKASAYSLSAATGIDFMEVSAGSALSRQDTTE